MASFYYNRSSGESAESQWAKYLQTQSFVNDIKGSVLQQTSDFNRFFNSSSKEQKEAILEATSNICGTLERGFAQLDGRLEDINNSLSDLHSMLDWKTDLLIEGIKISNIYLGNITQLLRIPDLQKQRAYCVEQGLIYLKNAIDEGGRSSFYKEALKELDKALAIESNDFFTLHRLGIIYYSSLKYLDIGKALNYFLQAAKYAKATANAKPVSMLAIGNNNGESDFRELFTRGSLYEEAASSLIFASRCYYILDKVNEGYLAAQEAFKLAPNNAEAGFQLLKMSVAIKQPMNALIGITLEKVIEIDRYYAIKILTDPELMESDTIKKKLNEITTKAIQKATQKYNDCIKSKIPKSVAEIQLATIKKKLYSNGFLGAMDALDLFKKKGLWNINKYHHDKDTNTITSCMYRFDDTLYDIIQKETEFQKEKIAIEEEIKEFERNSRQTTIIFMLICFVIFVFLVFTCS